MSMTTAYIIWITLGPTLLIFGWWLTKSIHSVFIQISIRGFLITATCSFHWYFGPIPLWALLVMDTKPFWVQVFLVWWVLISSMYFVIHTIAKKVRPKNESSYQDQTNETQGNS